MLNRRTFLRAAAAGPLMLTAGAGVMASAAAAPLFKISLAQWSLHRRLGRGGGKQRMTNLDFPKIARSMGIDAIEYVNTFFKDKARDAKYLADLKSRCDGENVESLLIMVDGEGHLGDPNAKRRAKAIDNHRRWADAAKDLGCHSIRVNAHSSGTYEDQMKLAALGLSALSEYGGELGLNVIVENHGGLSSNGAWLVGVMKKVGSPHCGTLPDFGNFDLGGGKFYDRYKGVEEMMPFAKAVSAKAHDFDDHGNEIHTDFEKMMRIVLDAGYRGHVGIEYEGGGEGAPPSVGEIEGIVVTKRLLERVRNKLTPEYTK